jgi:DtxR family Mn-dependent transcriptional regulator
LNYTTSEENYLKTIYHLQEIEGTVSTNALAEKLKAKPASITDMMKKLNAKKLLNYKPYYGFSLSNEGKKIAVAIVRRHRLWEYFLSEKLGFSWNEVHHLAEELEHVESKELINRLDAFLGFPPFDPHGDPIPDQKGKMQNVRKIQLPQFPLQQTAEVVQVTNQSPEMLELLHHKNIGIGTQLEVKRHFQFDGSIEIKVRNTLLNISAQVAENIYVRYEQDAQ